MILYELGIVIVWVILSAYTIFVAKSYNELAIETNKPLIKTSVVLATSFCLIGYSLLWLPLFLFFILFKGISAIIKEKSYKFDLKKEILDFMTAKD